MDPFNRNFSEARVLVVGDVILDRYWHGSTNRISPEAPVPVVRITAEDERPGGAGNVALNIRSLGGAVTLAGTTGDDAAAEALVRQLQQQGIRCLLSKTAGFQTVVKLRVLSQHQQLIRLDFEDPSPAPEVAALIADFQAGLETANVIVLSDYAKGSLTQAAQLIALARRAGKQVIVDPKAGDFSRYRGADVITPNLKEFEAVAGACVDDSDLEGRAQALCKRFDFGAVLVTRGEKGMSLVRRDRPAVHLPAQARDVFDVTGAGDTVCAVLATALAAGHDLVQATALANTAAGVVVGKLGAATVTPKELEAALHAANGARHGVVDEKTLLAEVQAARRRGERIVMTNGCFDILHAGHVQYLQQARQLGDRLIVAVNDDGSVRRLKGEGRPLNPLDQRMAVLAGLAAVDWVCGFGEDTPERLICTVKPDVLVKGGDYRPEQVAGNDCVRAGGGEVVILDFLPGCSSSRIIEAAQRARTAEETS